MTRVDISSLEHLVACPGYWVAQRPAPKALPLARPAPGPSDALAKSLHEWQAAPDPGGSA